MRDYRPSYRQYEMPMAVQVILALVTLFVMWMVFGVMLSF